MGGRQRAAHHRITATALTPYELAWDFPNSKFVITDSPGTPQTASAAAMAQLQADLEQLLQQREQMRAQLIAEQDRRERAEAELVKVGAQWLGTETQQALRARASPSGDAPSTPSARRYGVKRSSASRKPRPRRRFCGAR